MMPKLNLLLLVRNSETLVSCQLILAPLGEEVLQSYLTSHPDDAQAALAREIASNQKASQ